MMKIVVEIRDYYVRLRHDAIDESGSDDVDDAAVDCVFLAWLEFFFLLQIYFFCPFGWIRGNFGREE